jgi:flagellin-specific chaperone FliS
MDDPYAVAQMEGVSREWYPSLAWRGVLKYVAQAEAAIAAGDIPLRHACLMRAQNLVAILDHSFQDDIAPSIAGPLHQSHRDVLHYLAEANLQNRAEPLQIAREVAMVFEATWTQVAQEQVTAVGIES